MELQTHPANDAIRVVVHVPVATPLEYKIVENIFAVHKTDPQISMIIQEDYHFVPYFGYAR